MFFNEISLSSGKLSTLNPQCVRKAEPSVVTITNGHDVCVNTVFQRTSPMSGTLRTVVHHVANAWLGAILKPEEMGNYTTSTKPMSSSRTIIPAELLNEPVRILLECLSVEGGVVDGISSHVELLFKERSISQIQSTTKDRWGIECAREMILPFLFWLKMLKFLSLVIFFSVVWAALAKKTQYRTERINFIYEKALQHVTDRQNLARLEEELSGYDAIYLSSKANRQGSHSTKEFDKIDDKLANILEKYGLEKAVQAFKEKYKHKNVQLQTERNEPLPSGKFQDETLQKLWTQAQNGKFSPNELLVLHKELEEVERKMRVYEDKLEDFKKVPHENSVHHMDSDTLSEKTKKLKSANRELNNHLDAVYRKVTDEQYSIFEEPRVRRLWKLALENKKLSQHELNALKEELLHFENQLKKIEFHKEEVIRLQADAEEHGKGRAHVYGNLELSVKQEKLNRKARKLEKYLEEKIIMFNRSFPQFSRKRVASETVAAQQQLSDKTNVYTVKPADRDLEKKQKMTPVQKVCLKCLAGESGHITHVLSNIAK
ncbi:unnamed protein product [Caenorhabditis sp. 36 PRJEB53466]|nr:unnamed protein product [Caenorhabditis sp. 36 PRJEB53466]